MTDLMCSIKRAVLIVFFRWWNMIKLFCVDIELVHIFLNNLSISMVCTACGEKPPIISQFFFSWTLLCKLMCYSISGVHQLSCCFSSDKVCSTSRCWFLRMPSFSSNWNSLTKDVPDCVLSTSIHVRRKGDSTTIFRISCWSRISHLPHLHHPPGQWITATTIHFLVSQWAHGELWCCPWCDGGHTNCWEGKQTDH